MLQMSFPALQISSEPCALRIATMRIATTTTMQPTNKPRRITTTTSGIRCWNVNVWLRKANAYVWNANVWHGKGKKRNAWPTIKTCALNGNAIKRAIRKSDMSRTAATSNEMSGIVIARGTNRSGANRIAVTANGMNNGAGKNNGENRNAIKRDTNNNARNRDAATNSAKSNSAKSNNSTSVGVNRVKSNNSISVGVNRAKNNNARNRDAATNSAAENKNGKIKIDCRKHEEPL